MKSGHGSRSWKRTYPASTACTSSTHRLERGSAVGDALCVDYYHELRSHADATHHLTRRKPPTNTVGCPPPFGILENGECRGEYLVDPPVFPNTTISQPARST